MEKEIDHVLSFLDVLIDNTHYGSVVTSAYRKKTFTGLLTKYSVTDDDVHNIETCHASV